jgi:hypothetical protein
VFKCARNRCSSRSGIGVQVAPEYAIDTAVCPDTVPQATMACDVPECTLCNLAGNYADSSGAAKVGYCVCGEPNGDGERSWTCASDTAWPCPGGSGC